MRKPSPRILFVDGPNLNVLGKREPSVYGGQTLEDIRKAVSAAARREGAEVTFFQSNHEGEIVDRLQRAREEVDGDRHQSRRLHPHQRFHPRRAPFSGLPAIELHLSNPSSREEFRKVSLVEDIVVGRICGIGGYGYVLALQALLHVLRERGGRAGK